MATSPTAPCDAEELARLRAEHRALADQVKLLVQTEQRLYRTQHAREQEVRRIETIGAFALDAVGQSQDGLVDRTLAVLHECFALDAAVAVVARGDTIEVRGQQEGTVARPAAAALLWTATRAAVIDLAATEPMAAAARAMLAALGLATDGVCALVPVGLGRLILAVSDERGRPAVRAEPLAVAHLPLLVLIATHVARLVDHAALTADLQRRSASLAEANRQLADSVHRLEATQAQLIAAGKMEAIGRLAGGVAHDFNNLLTVILSHATLAADELSADSPAAIELEGVIDASKRAAEITSQLLALGRTTVQKREYVDVGRAVADLGRVLTGLLGRTVKLAVTSEPGCGVFADRAQIEQVMLNLVINARDAMPGGGTVRVAVRTATPDDRAWLEPAVRPRPWVALEVADSGVGMDDETRARIFEPFFTTKPVGRGTGLGLSVVYGAVTQTEGTIAVDSQPGVGTRFIVLLPQAAPQPAVVRAPQPAVATGARVLVVEDSEAIRKLAARILLRAGYGVVEAADGAAALALVEAAPDGVELVLTDLNMPRMGGLELSRRLAAVAPALPVLFMTGYSEELAAVSRQAPAMSCMTKPFTPAQLLGHVGRRLAEEPSDAAPAS